MNRLQDTLASDPAPQHFTHSDEIVTEWVPSSKGMAWEKADSTCAREAKITSSNCWPYWSVLGLARTGLIFTGLQEGAQPRGWGLTPPGQTEPGIPYRVTSRWVPKWGGGAGGTHSQLGSAQRRSCPGERVSCASLPCSTAVNPTGDHRRDAQGGQLVPAASRGCGWGRWPCRRGARMSV